MTTNSSKTKKPGKEELQALFRLEFYKNKKKWKLAASKESTNNLKNSKNVLNETFVIKEAISEDSELNKAFVESQINVDLQNNSDSKEQLALDTVREPKNRIKLKYFPRRSKLTITDVNDTNTSSDKSNVTSLPYSDVQLTQTQVERDLSTKSWPCFGVNKFCLKSRPGETEANLGVRSSGNTEVINSCVYVQSKIETITRDTWSMMQYQRTDVLPDKDLQYDNYYTDETCYQVWSNPEMQLYEETCYEGPYSECYRQWTSSPTSGLLPPAGYNMSDTVISDESLDSFTKFMEGAHAAPHSSEVDLRVEEEEGERGISSPSPRQLTQKATHHADLLRTLLHEFSTIEKQNPGSRADGRATGRGRVGSGGPRRLLAHDPSTPIIGISMGRPYRL